MFEIEKPDGCIKNYKIFSREMSNCEEEFSVYWIKLIIENIDSFYKETIDYVVNSESEVRAVDYIVSPKIPIQLSKLGNEIFFDLVKNEYEYQEKIAGDEVVRLGSISINNVQNSKLLELINSIGEAYEDMF